ncbi:MAG: ATP-binding cassette domain-containing protein [Ruminococcaceae bacterium]|nr:ATP-binding cassette domain-containing protein [Oscillospiraceae bacterium]
MLEVKNLKKIYKTKNDVVTDALDGVSIQFPEKGLVFLLGKSGSGKSTLLNVCGGLDAPSEGEIIVKGRSSKDFTQSDFDSYRNTFVGFIFQEYNILDEFSVEDNIALALELQGKPKDKESINKLLKDVDLEGFAKRKPNTLSGGQKQRIAIARALIKSPEIIMADEPTGALDSATGKQVFETLKKLSRDKLIVVVSHDRDFAEEYGDRIIELKDGKILSDVTKTEVKTEELTENINSFGDVLCVKNGAELTDGDFEKIKSFLKNSKEDVIIANGEKDVKKFKKASRISDNGEKEVFKDTDVSDLIEKEYTGDESKFIRSKLPLKHAFKIGVSSLKNKPVRLVLTILLCTIAFVLFSLLTTLNFYDSEATFLQTMADSDNSMIQLKKEFKTQVKWVDKIAGESEYESVTSGKFTNDDLKAQAKTFGKNAFGGVNYSANFSVRQTTNPYWVTNVSAFAVLNEDNGLRNDIIGEYPVNDNEMMITSYIADMLYNCGVFGSQNEALNLKSAEDIIGKSVVLGGIDYKITGILKVPQLPAEYEILKESTEESKTLLMDYNLLLTDGIYLIAFVTENHLKTLSQENTEYVESLYNYTEASVAVNHNEAYSFPDWSNACYMDYSNFRLNDEVKYISPEKTVLEERDAIISSIALASVASEYFYNLADSGYYSDRYYRLGEIANNVSQGGEYSYDIETEEDIFTAYTKEEIDQKLDEILQSLKNSNGEIRFGLKLYDKNNNIIFGDVEEFNIIGVYYEDRNNYSMGKIVISDKAFKTIWDSQKNTLDYYAETKTNYVEEKSAIYTNIYLPFVYSEELANDFWAIYENKNWSENDSRLALAGNFVDQLESVDHTVKELSTAFLYVGLVLAVFAVLLFSNFISVSISNKIKEIGILRAVGARSVDVFKIFFSESFVIAAICVLVSTLTTMIACKIMNIMLATEIGASLMVFGIGSFFVLVGISVVTAVVATFLPVYSAAKKKPVESIRSI